MNGRSKLQFSLSNLLLAMAPLAVFFSVASYAYWSQWKELFNASLAVAIAPVVGALVRGRIGLGVGCVIAYFVFLFLVLVGWLNLDEAFRLWQK